MYEVYLDTDDNELFQVNTKEHKRSTWFPSFCGNNALSNVTIPFDMDIWFNTLPTHIRLLVTSTECVTKDTHPELFI